MCGLSRQVASHISGLSRQVSLYNLSALVPFEMFPKPSHPDLPYVISQWTVLVCSPVPSPQGLLELSILTQGDQAVVCHRYSRHVTMLQDLVW